MILLSPELLMHSVCGPVRGITLHPAKSKLSKSHPNLIHPVPSHPVPCLPAFADLFFISPPRPLSSTSASIILNPAAHSSTYSSSSSSSLYAVIGGSGGSRIFPSVAQVLINLFSGLDISESIEAYRVHNQIVPDLTTIEVGPEGVDQGIVKALKERGHHVGEFDVNIGISEGKLCVSFFFLLFFGSHVKQAR